MARSSPEFLNVTTPEKEIREAELKRRLGQRARGGEAMEERGEAALPHFVLQDRGGVVLGVARVNHERQA